MDFVKDTLLVYGRIITILPLVLFITLLMGRRSIGELPVFDFLIIISLGAVVGADLSDPEIRHFHTVMTIIGIGLLQIIITYLSIRRRRFGKWITFEPIVVIKNGTLLVGNLRKIRYSVDNILQMLREKGVFDVSEVELAIVEANGNLSVYKQSNKTPVTIEDLGIRKKEEGLSYPIILEGKLYHEVLQDLEVDETWLYAELEKQGIDHIKNIFYASLTKDKKLHVSLKNESTLPTPVIHH
ncbi:DUF421 domain-containing protein [Niallia sp. Krafla_26]|uniref:DUF421 domain-containing protein n=1 Tax=Niallia sp. Krafla_26 TaxID=3064703 RepID=UPI003D176CDC